MVTVVTSGAFRSPSQHLPTRRHDGRRTGRRHVLADHRREAVAAADEQADRAQFRQPRRPRQEVARHDDESVADRDAREGRPSATPAKPRREPRTESSNSSPAAIWCRKSPRLDMMRAGIGAVDVPSSPAGGVSIAAGSRGSAGVPPATARHLGRIDRDEDEARATVRADEGGVRIGPDAGYGAHAVDRRQVEGRRQALGQAR